ncbi:MAG TPA: MFS transporter [Azospirillum sp.]
MTARTNWGAVLVAVAAGIVAALHVGKVPPAIPLLRAELSLGLVAGGWVMSMFNALGMLTGIGFGLFADIAGQRRMAFIGFAALLVGGLIGAGADGAAALLFGRFLEGAGFIAIGVSLPAVIIAAAAPADRRFALSLWAIYTPAGSAAAMLVASWAQPAFGWRGLWFGVAIAGGLVALLFWRVTRGLALPRPSGAPALGMVADTLRQPGLWALALAFVAYVFQWVSLMVWLPSSLIDTHHLTPAVATLLTALVVFVNVPGNIAGGWLMQRGVARGWLIAAASAAMGVSSTLALAGAVPDLLRYALCLAFSFCGGLLPAACLSGAAVHAPSPRHIGLANGLIVQGSNLGQFVGPPLIAAAVSLAGGDWHAASLPMALAAAAGVALGLFVLRLERRR